MASWVRLARKSAGLATVGVMLGMIVTEFAFGVPIVPGRLSLMLALTGGLLGFDVAAQWFAIHADVNLDVGYEHSRGNEDP